MPVRDHRRRQVPAGSFAQGVISEVKRGRHSELQIQLTTLMLPSGEVLQVTSKASSPESVPTRASDSAFGVFPLLGLSAAGAIAGGEIGARAGLGAGAAMMLVSAIAGHRRDMELRQGAAVDVVFEAPSVLAH